MAKFTQDELLEAFGEMTLVELSEFVKAFEEKFDVEASAPVAVAAAAAPGAAPAEEEKDEFDVILSAVGDKKIQVIKAVRGITNLGLAALRSRSSSTPRRKTPRRPRLSSKKLAPPSSSSDLRGISRISLQDMTSDPVGHKPCGVFLSGQSGVNTRRVPR